MEKLMTPGPTPLPDFVREAMAQPVIHHHFPEFRVFYTGLQQRMQYLFQTRSQTLTAPGSGTYGVEMAMYSLWAPGDRVVVAANGKFSQRWVDYGRFRGLNVKEVQTPWGASPQPEQIALACFDHRPQGVVITHCETSTGALADLETLASAIREAAPDALLVADAITTVGALPYYHDAWAVDLTLTSSQKALMCPAGLSLYALSERACQRLETANPSDFAHLGNHLRAAREGRSPFTPPVTLMFAAEAALRYLEQRTLPAVWNEVHAASQTFKSGVTAMGATLEGGDAPADSLTSFFFPGKNADLLLERLRNNHRILLSGGQDAWKGRVLRIAHMGMAANPDWTHAALHALRQEVGKEEILRD